MTLDLTYRTWIAEEVETTDGSATTIATIEVPTETTVHIHGHVVARRTGGSSGTAEDGAGYTFAVTYKNVAGTATLIGSGTLVATHEDQSGWDVTFTASSGNALIQVTGAADNNVAWYLEYRKVVKSS